MENVFALPSLKFYARTKIIKKFTKRKLGDQIFIDKLTCLDASEMFELFSKCRSDYKWLSLFMKNEETDVFEGYPLEKICLIINEGNLKQLKNGLHFLHCYNIKHIEIKFINYEKPEVVCRIILNSLRKFIQNCIHCSSLTINVCDMEDNIFFRSFMKRILKSINKKFLDTLIIRLKFLDSFKPPYPPKEEYYARLVEKTISQGDKLKKFVFINEINSLFTPIFVPKLLSFTNVNTLKLHGVYNDLNPDIDMDLFVKLAHQLPTLRELDLSIDIFSDHLQVSILSELVYNLLMSINLNKSCQLEILDISGIKLNVELFEDFVEKNINLKKLYCIFCFDDFILKKKYKLKVYNLNELEDIMECLERYYYSEIYVFNLLINMNNIFQYSIVKKPNILINLLSSIILDNINIESICVLACGNLNHTLYYILNRKVHTSIVIKAVEAVMECFIMHTVNFDVTIYCIGFLNHIIRKTLLNIECYRLALLYSNFIHFNGSTAVEEFMEDTLISHSVLASRMNSIELSIFGNHENISNLLEYIRFKDRNSNWDSVSFQQALITLWNYLDECEEAAKVFVKKNGLVLFNFLFIKHVDNLPIIYRLIGPLSNIAEIPCLIKYFFDPNLFQHIVYTARSNHFSVSYLAVYTLCNMVLEWEENVCRISLNDILALIKNKVDEWGISVEKDVVSYRSFKTMLIFLKRADLPILQYFAIWAIRYVSKCQPDTHYSIIVPEEIYAIIRNLAENSSYLTMKAAKDVLNFLITGEYTN